MRLDSVVMRKAVPAVAVKAQAAVKAVMQATQPVKAVSLRECSTVS